MRKLDVSVIIMLIAAMLCQACNSNNGSKSVDSVTSTTTTTIKIPVTYTSKTGALSTTLDSSDVKFANTAAIGGMAEVALGKLAQQKTSNMQIKEFANMMVADHSRVNDELTAIAKTRHVSLPATVDAEHQEKMNDLSKKSGSDFDKAYVNAMVTGHKATLALMRNEAETGKDSTFKTFAGKTSVTVQMHLAVINKIHDSMK